MRIKSRAVRQKEISKAVVLKFIILIGLTSFFADMIYEAARSITGSFLATLGTSAAIVGFVAGFGSFWFLGSVLIGVLYAFSVISVVIFSVIIQLLAVPLLIGVKKRIEKEV